MSSGKSPIDEFLLSAQVMIENALSDPKVKAALAVYGYTEEKLTAGKTLYTEATALQNAQKKEYGEQVAATAELNAIWETADQQYMKTLKIARVAFQDHVKADKATMLFGSRKRSLSGWLAQTQAFYANIQNDPNLMNALTQYGYSQAKLEQEAGLLNHVAAKKSAAEK